MLVDKDKKRGDNNLDYILSKFNILLRLVKNMKKVSKIVHLLAGITIGYGALQILSLVIPQSTPNFPGPREKDLPPPTVKMKILEQEPDHSVPIFIGVMTAR